MVGCVVVEVIVVELLLHETVNIDESMMMVIVVRTFGFMQANLYVFSSL